MDLSNDDLKRPAAADRREIDPPVQVEAATWTKAGQLDWRVKERRPRVEWFGRVRGEDGRQRWIKAVDLRREQFTAMTCRRYHRPLRQVRRVAGHPLITRHAGNLGDHPEC